MKPCPHKHVEARIWSRQWKEWCVVAPTYQGQADALICRDCRAWLGVGESDEKPVAVEVRAAEIAIQRGADGDPVHRALADGAEYAGWLDHAFDSNKAPDQDDEWAGWLAREIATHHDDPLAEAIEQAERAGV